MKDQGDGMHGHTAKARSEVLVNSTVLYYTVCVYVVSYHLFITGIWEGETINHEKHCLVIPPVSWQPLALS